MTIHVQCPGCGSQFAAPAQMAGQSAQCIRCQSVVSIPPLPPPAPSNSRPQLPVWGLGLAAAALVGGAAIVLGLLWIGGRSPRRLPPPAPPMAYQAPQQPVVEEQQPWRAGRMEQQTAWLVTPPALAVAPDNALTTTRRDFPIAFERLILPRDHTRYAVGVTPDANGRPQLHRVDLLTCQPTDEEPSVFPYDGFDLALAEASPDGRFVACLQFGVNSPTIKVYGTADQGQGLQSNVGESSGRHAALRFASNNRLLSVTTTARDRLIFTLHIVPTVEVPKRTIDPLVPASQVDLRTLAVSTGGQFAALVWPQDRSIRIWNLDAGQTAGTIQLKTSATRGDLAWSPDGRRLAFVDRGASGLHLAVFDMATGQAVFQTDYDQPLAAAADRYEGRAIDWSSDGGQLLLGGAELFDATTGDRVDSLRILDPQLAGRPRRIIQPGVLLQCLTASNAPCYLATPIDQWLASYQPPTSPMPEPTVAAVPETPSAAPPAAIAPEKTPPPATTAKTNPPPSKPAVADPPPAATAAAGKPAEAAPAPATAPTDAAWSLPLDPPAAQTVFKSGRISMKIDGFDALVFPPTPSRFCLIERSAMGQRVRFMLDLATAKPIGKEVVADEIRGSDVVVSPDGRYFAGEIHPSRHLGVWSLATGQSTCGIAPPQGEQFGKFTFVGPHRLVAFHNADSKTTATIWDVRNGKNHGQLVVDGEWCSGNQLAIAPSPGGKYLAVLCEERLKIVDPSGPSIVAERSLAQLRDREFIRLLGATIDLSHVECFGLAWSPDGSRLALVLQSGLDGYLVCLDARTGGTVSQRVLRTRNLDSEFGALRHVENNRVDWTWDSSAILLGGTQLYDAPTAKELFALAFSAREGDQPRRIIRAWDALTVARDRDGDSLLFTFALSKEALTKAIQQVRQAGEAVDSLLPPLTVPKFDGVKTVQPAMPHGAWTSLVDGVPPIAGLPDAIDLPEQVNDVRRVRFASPASSKLVFVASSAVSDGKGTTTRTTRIQQIDAVTKKAGPSIVIPDPYELEDVSPDGQLALLAFRAGTSTQRLDLVGVNPKSHVAGWRPYSDEDPIASATQDDKPRTIHWAALVDNEHVFTLSQAGRLILWKLPECQAVYQLTGVETYNSKEFSPSRKYLALRAGGQMVLLESLTGTRFVLPAFPDNVQPSRCAFRADGKELLAWYSAPASWSIRRIDAATGQTRGEFVQAFAAFPSAMRVAGTADGTTLELFRSDNLALLHGTTLVDLERNLLCWRYDAADRVLVPDNSPDHRIWYFHKNPQGRQNARLLALDPYREEVRAACVNLKAEDQFWLLPGDKIRVAIDLSGARLGADAAKTEAAARAAIVKAGLIENASAPLLLSITGFERDEPKTFTRSNGTKITVPDLKVGVRVAISDAAGQAIFGYEFVNPPVIDLTQPLAGQAEGDLDRKKRQLFVEVLLNHQMFNAIPGALLKDPRDILPGATLLGPSGPEPMPAERRLPPRKIGFNQTGP